MPKGKERVDVVGWDKIPLKGQWDDLFEEVLLISEILKKLKQSK